MPSRGWRDTKEQAAVSEPEPDSAKGSAQRLLINNSLVYGGSWVRCGTSVYVPFVVEVVAMQRAPFEAFHLLVCDLDAVGVVAGVHRRAQSARCEWWSRRWC